MESCEGSDGPGDDWSDLDAGIEDLEGPDLDWGEEEDFVWYL